MKNNIGPFTLYTNKDNEISNGHLYTLECSLPVPFEKKRIVRVYVPKYFNPNKKYPVLYMCDGQNIVDRKTSAYGEWDIDDHMLERINDGLKSFIVVGIDCPKNSHNRTLEYTIENIPYKKNLKERKIKHKPYGDKLGEYIVNELKPLIDQYFPTIKEKEFTGIGGSSMGGLFSFQLACKYREIFGFCLSFSPAFMLYKNEIILENIKKNLIGKVNENTFFLYSGGSGYDSIFYTPTKKVYELMKDIGFDDDHLAIWLDENFDHNEYAWSYHFNAAITFWLD